MSEGVELVLLIIVLVAVFILTRKFALWRAERTIEPILEDLKKRDARDESSAVNLSYAKRNMLWPGTHDFRVEGLKFLLARGLVEQTADGRFYLAEEDIKDRP